MGTCNTGGYYICIPPSDVPALVTLRTTPLDDERGESISAPLGGVKGSAQAVSAYGQQQMFWARNRS